MPSARIQCARQVRLDYICQVIHIICNKISTDGNAVAKTASIRGNSIISMYLSGLDCIGTEKNLSQCPRKNRDFCIKLGAGVICPLQQNGDTDEIQI